MSNTAGERLQSLVERIERLEEEKRALAANIKDVYAEAKGAGFDAKTLRALVRERRMESGEREEHLALMEVYRTALGMTGAPLSDAARRRLSPPAPPPESQAPPPMAKGRRGEGAKGDAAAGAEGVVGAAAPAAAMREAPGAATPEQLLSVRAEGAAAAKAGRPVMANPYPAGDTRRGAWDEGWCAAGGSDGMDLPDAWRRSKPKGPDEKPAKGA